MDDPQVGGSEEKPVEEGDSHVVSGSISSA